MTIKAKYSIGVMLAISFIGMNSKAATAGWLDMINQVSSKYNEANQQVQTLKNANQQIQQVRTAAASASTNNTTNTNKPSHNSPASTNNFEKTKTTNAITGDWGTQFTCEGNSSTCANGLDDMANCMHQGKGYYYRVVAANLQNRLDTDKDLTGDDKITIKEDIASVKGAIETDKVVDPDPAYPQRWLAWLSKEDQQQTIQTNSKYMKEVHDDCEARFGGMTRYSGTGAK